MTAESLGLSPLDVGVLLGCPISGAGGSIVRAIMIRQSLELLPTVPADRDLFRFGVFYARFTWYVGWIVVGLASGTLIAFLFVGALAPGLPSVFRVLALALIAGYGAPALWKRQEDTIQAIVNARFAALNPAPTEAKKGAGGAS